MIQTNVAFHNILRNHRYIFRKIHKHAAGNRFTVLCLISKKGFGKSMDAATHKKLICGHKTELVRLINEQIIHDIWVKISV